MDLEETQLECRFTIYAARTRLQHQEDSGKLDLLRYVYEIAIKNTIIIFPSESVTTFLLRLLFRSQKSFRFTI